jgi:FkbM family methyltransferase
MSVKSKLSHYFNRPLRRRFIPVVNFILTLLRRNVLTKIVLNQQNSRYELYEGKKLIHVDVVPGWLLSRAYLKSIVMKVNLRYFALKPGHVVVDVGAGTGTEAIVYADLVGVEGQVFAIESHPETFRSLQTLIVKGGYSNIEAHQVAIGNDNGAVWLQNQHAHQKNALMEEPDIEERAVSVEMRTLDQFVLDNKIKQIDFLKVNIEGAELQMLEGMKQSIHIIRAAAVSCHDFIGNDNQFPIMNEVRNFFISHGFNAMHVPEAHPVANSWLYMMKD